MMEDIHLFVNVMLLGFASGIALVACLYLLLSSKIILSDNPQPYQALRRDAGWILAVIFGCQAIYYFLWVLSKREVFEVPYASFVDMILIMPFMYRFLIRLLQNQKFVWRWTLVAEIPLVSMAVAYGLSGNIWWFNIACILFILLLLGFTLWYFYGVRRYSQWLHENFSDLVHKETWWSFIMIALFLWLFYLYFAFDNSIVDLYSLRFIILIIVCFITWRADNVQRLSHDLSVASSEDAVAPPDFTGQLEQMAQESQFYLQYDLTLPQLAQLLGSNRTYVSSYFKAQGTTYNSYINSLRVEHFIRLYREQADDKAVAPSVKVLALQSGYRSYSTFYAAFKNVKGMNVSQWIEQEKGNQSLS